MRRPDRGDLLLLAAGAMIAGVGVLYASLLWGWIAGPPAPAPMPAPSVQAPAPANALDLAAARRSQRDGYLDARSWLRLSEELARAGRPVDAFYVLREAREFFGDADFIRAHAIVVEKLEPETAEAASGDPAEAERKLKTRLQGDSTNAPLRVALARLQARSGRFSEALQGVDQALALHPQDAGLLLAKGELTEPTDALAAIPHYARAAHLGGSKPQAKQALERLSALASGNEMSPRGEAVRLAREALEELRRAHPDDANVFAALGMAHWARGDAATVHALAVEASRKKPLLSAVAMLQGTLAMAERDSELALSRFTAAWETNAEDLYSAEKLAVLYSQHRGDEEAALPYWIALYRRRPERSFSGEPLDVLIRRTLDKRRKLLLKNVTAEGLGRFLKSEDASLRAEACERAAALKDPRWLEELAERLDDDVELVRRNADYALYQLGKLHPDALQVRRDDWLSGDRPIMRARVLNLFADLWPRETLPLAIRALYDPNPALRYLTKTLVFDRYYKDSPDAAKALADYLAQEKSPAVLERYKAK